MKAAAAKNPCAPKILSSILRLVRRLIARVEQWTLPSPARHGGCKKDSNRRAACPLAGQGEGSDSTIQMTTARHGIRSSHNAIVAGARSYVSLTGPNESMVIRRDLNFHSPPTFEYSSLYHPAIKHFLPSRSRRTST